MIHSINQLTTNIKFIKLGLFEQLCKHVKPSISHNACRNVFMSAGVDFYNNVYRRIYFSIKRKIVTN